MKTPLNHHFPMVYHSVHQRIYCLRIEKTRAAEATSVTSAFPTSCSGHVGWLLQTKCGRGRHLVMRHRYVIFLYYITYIYIYIHTYKYTCSIKYNVIHYIL